MPARNVSVVWLLVSWSISTAIVADQSQFSQWVGHRNQRVNDPDLVAYYDFQAGSGNALENQAKVNPELNGVIHGATWVEGRWPGKKALEFDGNDYVEIPHNRSLALLDTQQHGRGEITIEVSLCARSHDECGIVDRSSEGWGKAASYAIWITSRCAAGDMGDGASCQVAKDGVEIPVDSWIHLVFTVDASTLTVYKNGMVVNQTPRSLAGMDNGKPLLIGCMVPGKFHYKGLLDEIAIYRRALTEKEIHRHFRTKPRVTFQIP